MNHAEELVADFAVAVYRYCRAVSGSVTSWLRSVPRNAAVGGKPNSAHLAGLGADVVVESRMSTDDRHRLAAELGLRLIVESDHDHLQLLR